MKRFWKIAGIGALVIALGVAIAGGVAFAQAGEDGADGPFNFRERMHEAIAGILGIDVEKYDAAVEQAQGQVLDEAVAEGWLTQEQADRMRGQAEPGMGPGMPGGMHGPRGDKFGPGGFMGGPGHSLLDVAADELDMSVQDLLTELQDGKTIAGVAEEKGVDPQTIVDAYIGNLTETLKQAVEDGRITQKQADSMVEQAGERAAEQLDQTWEDCGPGGFRGGGRPDRFQSFPGQDDV